MLLNFFCVQMSTTPTQSQVVAGGKWHPIRPGACMETIQKRNFHSNLTDQVVGIYSVVTFFFFVPSSRQTLLPAHNSQYSANSIYITLFCAHSQKHMPAHVTRLSARIAFARARVHRPQQLERREKNC